MGKIIHSRHMHQLMLRSITTHDAVEGDDNVNSSTVDDFQWECSLCGTGIMTSLEEIVTHCRSTNHRCNYQTFEEQSSHNSDHDEFVDDDGKIIYQQHTTPRQLTIQDRLNEYRAIQARWAQQQHLRDRLDQVRAIQDRVVRLDQQQQQWHVNHTLMLSVLDNPTSNGDHFFAGAVRLLEMYERSQDERQIRHEARVAIHCSNNQHKIPSSLPVQSPTISPTNGILDSSNEKAKGLECIRMLAFC